MITEAKNIIVELETQCAGLHKANRRLKEELDQLQESMELSRDRESFVHSELSKAILKVYNTCTWSVNSLLCRQRRLQLKEMH